MLTFLSRLPVTPSAAFFLLLAAVIGAAPAAAAPDDPAADGAAPALEQRLEHEGIAVEMRLEPLTPHPDGKLREGDDVRVRFAIRDTTSGTPLSSLYPAAWMDRLPVDDLLEPPKACKEKVAGFIGGTLLAQPELDLNVYYVLALNEDATITVVDPLFGFGGSKLLDLIFLKSNGEDWVLDEERQRLYVSMPDAGQVAVISLADWRVIRNVDAGPRPRRLALARDGRYLWAASAAPGGDGGSGVVVIDADRLAPVAAIETGAGEHDLVLSADDRLAFVTNRDAGTVSVIDVRSLRKVADVATDRDPTSIAYSAMARAAYVTHRAAGTIVAVDGDGRRVVARMQVAPGVEAIRFAPGERVALAVNPETDEVYVVSAAQNRVVQTADVEDRPDQVAFTDELAYVRHQGSEIVLMIPLGDLGIAGRPVPVVDFPGGQHPPGRTDHPSLAPGIVQAPGATAVLISNPEDGLIYYYKEGMAAPMGHFKNYGRQPRAVAVVDRSLEEREPGVYETTVKLRRPGRYDLAFFLDAPQLTHCFPFEVEPDPEAQRAEAAARPLAIEPLIEQREVPVAAETVLRFRLKDPKTQTPRSDLTDLRAMVMRVPGTWHARLPASAAGDGLYEARFTPPSAGIYYVFLESFAAGLEVRDSSFVAIEAVERPAAAAAGDGSPGD